jgi:hypothetical protein
MGLGPEKGSSLAFCRSTKNQAPLPALVQARSSLQQAILEGEVLCRVCGGPMAEPNLEDLFVQIVRRQEA